MQALGLDWKLGGVGPAMQGEQKSSHVSLGLLRSSQRA